MKSPVALRGAFAAAVIVAVCAAQANASLATGPFADSAGVAWPPPRTAPDTLRAVASPADSATLFGVALEHAMARAAIARGDTARADSLWSDPRFEATPWAWDVAERRATLVERRRGAAAADSLLLFSAAARWPDRDRAAWGLRRARLRLALADTLGSFALLRQVVRNQPAIVALSVPSLALLDSLAHARGVPLAADDERAAAYVDAYRGAKVSAAARLARAAVGLPPGERFELLLRRVQWLREARRPKAARAACDTLRRLAPDDDARERTGLERARALRDLASTDSALALYARIARHTASTTTRQTAWWEYAREAQDRSRWSLARDGFANATAAGRAARFPLGLLELLLGREGAALAAWSGADDEASQFWTGVLMRRRHEPRGDSLLAVLAARPGFAFYRACARDTLGRPGWPRVVAAADSGGGLARTVSRLVAAGAGDEAVDLVVAARERDPRLPVPDASTPAALLPFVASAWREGAIAEATRWSETAFSAASNDSVAWAAIAWAYPPAFDAPLAAAADSAGLERALLWALVRQESRFDPAARSRSNALGLTQLKLATAGDVAERLRAPAPIESTLFAPERALVFGANYLAEMLRRFDGSVPVALAAYNAGPSAVRPDWRALLARGGDALYAECASNADSQDYVKRILGFRQAYRELRPHVVRY